jgi:hypothetical protein
MIRRTFLQTSVFRAGAATGRSAQLHGYSNQLERVSPPTAGTGKPAPFHQKTELLNLADL